MAHAPREVVDWLNKKYPRPQVDPEWLDACYNWLITEHNPNLLPLGPNTLPELLTQIELQLLQSDLSASTLPNTGFPPDLPTLDYKRVMGLPVLVEIIAVTDIGHSAFSLQNTRQARLDKADLAGLAAQRRERDGERGVGEGEPQADEEDEGPIPKYPRGMLRFELSDGHTIIKAIEFRKIPELMLGELELGYKMQLKDVVVRKGIAFLEPRNIIHKGYSTEDRVATQERDFVRSLRVRMGLNDLPDEDVPEGADGGGPPRPAPAPPPPPAAAPVPAPAAAAAAPPARPPPPAQAPPRQQAVPPQPHQPTRSPPGPANPTLNQSRTNGTTSHSNPPRPNPDRVPKPEPKTNPYPTPSNSAPNPTPLRRFGTMVTSTGTFPSVASIIEEAKSQSNSQQASKQSQPQPQSQAQQSRYFAGHNATAGPSDAAPSSSNASTGSNALVAAPTLIIPMTPPRTGVATAMVGGNVGKYDQYRNPSYWEGDDDFDAMVAEAEMEGVEGEGDENVQHDWEVNKRALPPRKAPPPPQPQRAQPPVQAPKPPAQINPQWSPTRARKVQLSPSPPAPPRPLPSPERSRAPLLRARNLVSTSPTRPAPDEPADTTLINESTREDAGSSDYGDEDIPIDVLEELDQVVNRSQQSQDRSQDQDQTMRTVKPEPPYKAVDAGRPPPPAQVASSSRSTADGKLPSQTQGRPRPRPTPMASSSGASTSRTTPSQTRGTSRTAGTSQPKSRPISEDSSVIVIEDSDEEQIVRPVKKEKVTATRNVRTRMDTPSDSRGHSRAHSMSMSPSKRGKGQPPPDDTEVIELSD